MLSEVMVSKNTIIGSESLPSSSLQLFMLEESLVSSLSVQVDLMALVFWALHNFVHLFKAFLHAYFLEVPCFLAVCALGRCGWACSAAVVFVSTSEATTDFKFDSALVCWQMSCS